MVCKAQKGSMDMTTAKEQKSFWRAQQLLQQLLGEQSGYY